MGSALRSYEPSDGIGDSANTGNVHKKQNDADLPDDVQRKLKDLKFEAIALKKAGDREGAKDKLRQMNDLRVKTRRAGTAAADTGKPKQDTSGSGEIDWESAVGAIDFDSLYKQRQQEKQVVDEFGVDLATVRYSSQSHCASQLPSSPAFVATFRLESRLANLRCHWLCRSGALPARSCLCSWSGWSRRLWQKFRQLQPHQRQQRLRRKRA